MSNDRIFLRNCEHYVSDSCRSVKQEVQNNNYDPKEWDNSKYESLSILKNEDSLSITQKIVNQIESNKDVNLDESDLIMFSSIHKSGYGAFWQQASYIQEITKAHNALACNIQQGCNSQLVSLELIISYLQANPNAKQALTLSVDSFENSAFDRWNADYGILYGDGGAGAIVSKNRGDYEIQSLVTQCHGELNGLHRLSKHHNDATDDQSTPYDIKATKKDYLNKFGIEYLSSTSLSAVKEVANKCLSENQLSMKDISKVILPNLGQKILENNYLPALKVPITKTLWSLGSTIGHIGSADAFISLSYLYKSEAIKKGEHVLVISAGSGFTWSAMLLTAC